jgi:hypothetical protein
MTWHKTRYRGHIVFMLRAVRLSTDAHIVLGFVALSPTTAIDQTTRIDT